MINELKKLVHKTEYSAQSIDGICQWYSHLFHILGLYFFGLSFTIFVFSDGHRGKKFFRDDYNYIEAVESFYKIHMKQQNFTDAKRMCALEGASLFYAQNDDEAHAVIEFWNKTHPSGDWTVFVGLTDVMTEGEFETIDGTYT